MTDPLMPAEAVAIAAVLEAHPMREKHWMRWVEKLRAIANEGTPVEPEIERGNGRLSASPSKATPGERANASTEGLTIDCKESRWL